MKYFFEEYLKKVKTNFADLDFASNKLDISLWPNEWKEIEYKSYKRFKKINLDAGDLQMGDNKNIFGALRTRNSKGHGVSGELTFETLSKILYYSLGEKSENGKRFYPSAGARYPLEFYLVLNKEIDSLKKGVYHYSVKENALVYLWENDLEGSNFFSHDLGKNYGTAYIVATSIIERSARKYGESALKFSYIETGLAFQNILLLSSAYNISNSICNHDDHKFEYLLDIDGETEFVTGVVTLGFPEIEKD